MIPNDGDVRAFIDQIEGPVRKRDAETLLHLMGRITGEPPRMWGPTIVGFGAYHYRYASGREGDASAAGFSPRKAATTVYLADGTAAHEQELQGLGEHTTGAVCLYIKDLQRVDLAVLESIIAKSYAAASASGFGQVAV
ncbi:hypothetical protein GCM10027413_21410 [Conyzicola nivalis]|uniref:YdhG-like domain-containing protein n=1 Tax=Conyzicola nivalis TaxID=1477021 RepID=A0A916SCH9_9MICO|nr:DUF1801 domain-containing protein [Conyzicola nivalis]GGA93607.1 hypothetical protein GCM10010979_05210 [Conyzicola nivalis]